MNGSPAISPAPIAMFVFNRLAHTRQTVEALANNELAAESEVFVFSDGPRSGADIEKVSAVREYLYSISGFKKVTIVERERNLGCARSIVQGVTEIVERFGRIIVVEDDTLPAPYFLRFMNQGLDCYADDKQVACIHGYLYPTEESLPETFFIRGADIWGWATWRRAWAFYEPDAGKLLQELKARGLSRAFDFDGAAMFSHILKAQVAGKVDTWDVQWCASAFLREMLTLYPGRSLVQNIGFDSSGTHCAKSDDFAVTLSREPVLLHRIALAENAAARQALKKFHRDHSIGRFKRSIIQLIWRMGSAKSCR